MAISELQFWHGRNALTMSLKTNLFGNQSRYFAFRFAQGEILIILYPKDHTNLKKVSVHHYKLGLAHVNIDTGIVLRPTGFEHFPLARSPLASQPFPTCSTSFLSGPVELERVPQ